MIKKTILAAASGSLTLGVAGAAVIINEIRPNPAGTDPAVELVEIRATSGELNFVGFWGSIEGDDESSFGVQDSGSVNVTFDLNGYATIDVGDIENPAATFYLSTSDHSSATVIGDITTSVDAIGIPDLNANTLYGTTLGGSDFPYVNMTATSDEAVNMFRDGVILEWYAIDSDGDIYDSTATLVDMIDFNVTVDETYTSFGLVNATVVAVPEPSSFALLGLGGLATLLRRRR